MKIAFPYLVAVVLILPACRKDRTCTCSTTSTGSNVTHTQTPGIPPLIPASDTTITSPINTLTNSSQNYHKVSRQAVRASCPETSSETFNESSLNTVPGIFTITTTQSGIRTTSCKIS